MYLNRIEFAAHSIQELGQTTEIYYSVAYTRIYSVSTGNFWRERNESAAKPMLNQAT